MPVSRERRIMIMKVFSSNMARDNIIANLIDMCPDGIIGVDLHGTVVICNAKAAALTRRKCEEVLGCLDIGRIYGSREQARRIKAALYSEDFGGAGRLDGFETAIVDIDNKTIPIRLSAALIIENGNELGSVGFFHDLTHQKITDKGFRYGGDEFFVLLPETNLDQAMITAEKIRQQFNDGWPYETGGTGVLSPVTIKHGGGPAESGNLG